jgi:ComF family protein
MFATYLRNWKLNEIDLIIPVPLHRKRLRQRGFNQAYLLVSNWGRITGKMNLRSADVAIEKKMLFRRRHTAPQTGLGRAERKHNIKKAFGITEPAKINNKRLLLVDDVYTTGATVNECAEVLLKNGAERVDVLTLARAV